MKKENEGVVNSIQWIASRLKTWDTLCHMEDIDIKFEEAIELLKTLVQDEKYLLALFFIHKISLNKYVEEALMNTIVGIIGGNDTADDGTLTIYVKELNKIAEKYDIMSQKIRV